MNLVGVKHLTDSTSDDDDELLEISCDVMFWWWRWPNCTTFPRAWWAARCSEIPEDSVKLESGLIKPFVIPNAAY